MILGGINVRALHKLYGVADNQRDGVAFEVCEGAEEAVSYFSMCITCERVRDEQNRSER
jgi:hypothetical protein